jgi:hypothetical protein
MTRTPALIAIVMMFAASTHAQTTMTFGSNPPPSAFATDPIIRISSFFRTTAAMTDGQTIPDARSQEAARRELYRMAENECLVLSEIYKADFRLSSLTVNGLFSTTPDGPPPNVMTANGAYELRARRAQ